MDVKTLIKKLQKLPPATEVVIQKDEEGWHCLEDIVSYDTEAIDPVVSLNWVD